MCHFGVPICIEVELGPGGNAEGGGCDDDIDDDDDKDSSLPLNVGLPHVKGMYRYRIMCWNRRIWLHEKRC